MKHLPDDRKVPDGGTHLGDIDIRVQTRRDGCGGVGRCMHVHSLNVIHVILVRLYIERAVNDVQMSLR